LGVEGVQILVGEEEDLISQATVVEAGGNVRRRCKYGSSIISLMVVSL
jgi:hypothetical protein